MPGESMWVPSYLVEHIEANKKEGETKIQTLCRLLNVSFRRSSKTCTYDVSFLGVGESTKLPIPWHLKQPYGLIRSIRRYGEQSDKKFITQVFADGVIVTRVK